MQFICNLGVDVDGTLTKEIIGKEMLSLPSTEVEKAMLNCSPKNGIDILFKNDCDIFIITGRQEKFREVTTDWLDMYGIPYKDISMFPNNFYIINGYSVPKYAQLKLDMHIKKDIHLAFDDNIDVVNYFNAFGVNTCRVTDDFKEAFDRALNGQTQAINEINNK